MKWDPIIHKIQIVFHEILLKMNEKYIMQLRIDQLNEIDSIVEELITRIILNQFPYGCIVGEEHGVTNSDSELVFYLDPIDGSRALLNGRTDFAISIACCHYREFLGALVFLPSRRTNWLFEWYKGDCFRMDRIECPRLLNSRILPSTNIAIAPFQLWAHSTHKEILGTNDLYEIGSIANRISLVSASVFSASINVLCSTVRIWDIAAGLAFINAVGGTLINEFGVTIDIKDYRLDPMVSRFYLAGNYDLVSEIYERYKVHLENQTFERTFKMHLD